MAPTLKSLRAMRPRLPSLASLALLLGIACADQAPVGHSGPGGKADGLASFEDFKAGLYCEPDSETCIVEGDIPVFSEAALRELYQRLIGGGQALSVMHSDSADAIWDRTKRFDLGYCVSDTFGERKADVVTAMAEATADWESIAHVRFRYAPEHDGRCNSRNVQVLFDVSPAPEFAFYLARAFFPNSLDRAERQVLINVPAMDDALADPGFAGKLTMRGVLRHELGHVLGFRHEHIRPENSEAFFCREDEDFRPLTEYDAKSVMHYPQCDGEGDWSLAFTPFDEQGARFFYPDFDRFAGGRCTVEIKGTGLVNDTCAPIVHEILELANTGSFELLDQWVGLDQRAATEVVSQRSTHPFTALQELRDVTYLGEGTVRRMYDYLYVDGRCPIEIDREGRVDTLCRPVVHRVLELANKAPLAELDDDVSLDRRAADNIVARRQLAPFTDLAELWAVPYVKDRALAKMYRYIYE